MYKKIVLVMITLMLLALIIISCNRESKLVGKWELEKETEVFLETMPIGSSIEFGKDDYINLFGNSGTYEYERSGKLKMIINSQISFARYKIKKNMLTITLEGTGVMTGQKVDVTLKKAE